MTILMIETRNATFELENVTKTTFVDWQLTKDCKWMRKIVFVVAAAENDEIWWKAECVKIDWIWVENELWNEIKKTWNRKRIRWMMCSMTTFVLNVFDFYFAFRLRFLIFRRFFWTKVVSDERFCYSSIIDQKHEHKLFSYSQFCFSFYAKKSFSDVEQTNRHERNIDLEKRQVIYILLKSFDSFEILTHSRFSSSRWWKRLTFKAFFSILSMKRR